MAAVTIFNYVLLLGAGAFLYLTFLIVGDVFGTVQGIFLDTFPGVITEQTITAANFVSGVLVSAPFLIMITLFIWAIVKGASN